MTLAPARSAAKPAPAPPPEDTTILGRALAATPRGEYVELPGVGRVWIELAGGTIVDEIESATFAAMAKLGLPPVGINMPTYDSYRLRLTLAHVVRSPDDHSVKAGTQARWLEVDIDLVQACGIVYADVRERLNPISQPIAPEEFEAIRLAHEKKNPMLLRLFGVVLLSNYLTTGVDPPASSPTTASSTGASS